MTRPAAGDEEDAKESEQTATHELDSLLTGCAFKVSVEDGAANDDTQSEGYKLDGNYLSRVETCERFVQISDLHHGS